MEVQRRVFFFSWRRLQHPHIVTPRWNGDRLVAGLFRLELLEQFPTWVDFDFSIETLQSQISSRQIDLEEERKGNEPEHSNRIAVSR